MVEGYGAIKVYPSVESSESFDLSTTFVRCDRYALARAMGTSLADGAWPAGCRVVPNGAVIPRAVVERGSAGRIPALLESLPGRRLLTQEHFGPYRGREPPPPESDWLPADHAVDVKVDRGNADVLGGHRNSGDQPVEHVAQVSELICVVVSQLWRRYVLPALRRPCLHRARDPPPGLRCVTQHVLAVLDAGAGVEEILNECQPAWRGADAVTLGRNPGRRPATARQVRVGRRPASRVWVHVRAFISMSLRSRARW